MTKTEAMKKSTKPCKVDQKALSDSPLLICELKFALSIANQLIGFLAKFQTDELMLPFRIHRVSDFDFESLHLSSVLDNDSYY